MFKSVFLVPADLADRGEAEAEDRRPDPQGGDGRGPDRVAHPVRGHRREGLLPVLLPAAASWQDARLLQQHRLRQEVNSLEN